jgi:hypothetical protein
MTAIDVALVVMIAEAVWLPVRLTAIVVLLVVIGAADWAGWIGVAAACSAAIPDGAAGAAPSRPVCSA